MLYYGCMDPKTNGPPPLDDDTPADLEGLINFVNSRASIRRPERWPERFDTPADSAAFAPHCDLASHGQPLSPQDPTRLRRMRDAIVHAVKEPTDPRAWAAIN